MGVAYIHVTHKGVLRSDRCTWKSNEYAADISAKGLGEVTRERVLLGEN